MTAMPISYRVIRSSRKTAAIQITPGGEVLVRCPNRMSKQAIESLVSQKEGWIRAHLDRLRPEEYLPPFTEQELHALAQKARERIIPRLDHYAPQVGVNFARVTVRAQKTRLGSCSKGNLNFNCLLALVPPEVLDYVIVHELCHRKEMNHSPAFWLEVEKILPDYRSRRSWLKSHGNRLIARLP